MSRRSKSSFFSDEAVKKFCKQNESLGWYPESPIAEYEVVDGKYKVFKQHHLTTQVSTKQQIRYMLSTIGDSYERFIVQSIRERKANITEKVAQQIAREITREVEELLLEEVHNQIDREMTINALESVLYDLYRETVDEVLFEIAHESILEDINLKTQERSDTVSSFVQSVFNNMTKDDYEEQQDDDGMSVTSTVTMGINDILSAQQQSALIRMYNAGYSGSSNKRVKRTTIANHFQKRSVELSATDIREFFMDAYGEPSQRIIEQFFTTKDTTSDGAGSSNDPPP
eukprot:4140244-Pleurochrysis_carterae.AAC.6